MSSLGAIANDSSNKALLLELAEAGIDLPGSQGPEPKNL
jgi:hypothetical protein